MSDFSALTVTQLNTQIKALLESTFLQVYIEGEVSRVTYHSSGHLYFTIKDAQSALSCVMFRSNASRLKFRLEEGLHVRLFGAVTVYIPRGNYQLMVERAEPFGAGALALAYEQLKRKLESEGLFDKQAKKSIPRFVRRIAVVTSKTGAAIADMRNVARKRWPLAQMTLFDTLVQGAGAADEIARHIRAADALGSDVIVVGRGGGSLEDLWAFNEETVARAIAGCKTPVVSAVGHEVDVLISDFVADLRAPTPSAAMELILPDRIEMLYLLDEMAERAGRSVKQTLFQKGSVLKETRLRLERQHPQRRLMSQGDWIKEMQSRLQELFATLIQVKALQVPGLREQMVRQIETVWMRGSMRCEALQAQYGAVDPAKRFSRGTVQISRNERSITLDEIAEGDIVSLQDTTYRLDAEILSKRKL